jgi:uncharacterized protein
MGIRLVTLRIGIVLSPNGGALKEIIKPLTFKIAGILGSGKQYTSWVAIADLMGIMHHAITHTNVNGVYNAVATEYCTNKQLTLRIAQLKCGKFFIPLPVPAFFLKLLLGGLSIEVLKSCKVSNEKIRATGYQFTYSKISDYIIE